ncbi:MAG TPA: 4-hydroxybenzoate octaprenyltransferase [Longimicrobiales bacterium]
MSGGADTQRPDGMDRGVAGPGTAGAAPLRREGQTFGGESLLARYASFVKLPHTLFALPFAGVGVVWGAAVHPQGITAARVGWVAVAFTAARFAAMGFNRIVDRHYDALNPRTRLRELPTGRLSVRQAAVSVAVAAAVFIFAAWRLNPLCGWLSPVALAWVLFYSYTKRFTAWAHAALGLSLGIAPAGAYLAATGAWSDPWYALVILAAAVTCWVAGFDVIYAVQDEAFDRAHGLHSIPARLGTVRALRLARLLHFLAVVAFFSIWALGVFPVHWLYLTGVGVMAMLLHLEHAPLRRPVPERLDPVRIDRAFFRANAQVSAAFFLFTLFDRILAP